MDPYDGMECTPTTVCPSRYARRTFTGRSGWIGGDEGDAIASVLVLQHPAGILPWQRLERQGIEVRVVVTDGARIDHDRFVEAVSGVDPVCFSAVTWSPERRFPWPNWSTSLMTPVTRPRR
ncbi:hypothetical protein [Natrarchaeobius versutus]|uniref:hypothetical protein n=1 Tax=Natrarchaeobius versutus TaxID=1679078 RepID=UPI00350F1C08